MHLVWDFQPLEQSGMQLVNTTYYYDLIDQFADTLFSDRPESRDLVASGLKQLVYYFEETSHLREEETLDELLLSEMYERSAFGPRVE